MSTQDEDLEVDPVKMSAFFNELEIGQDDPSDLELLLEAERRGLLDYVCTQMLAEARKRSLVPPREASELGKGTYSARYLGNSRLPRGVDRNAQSQSVTNGIILLLNNTDLQPQLLCDVQISNDGIKMFYTEGPTAHSEEPVHWHTIASMKLCATYDRVLVTVVRVAEGQQEHIVLHAYKCKDRKKRWYLQESQTAQAQEAAGLLNRICQTIQATARNPVRMSRIAATVRTDTMTRPESGGFGFNFVGPAQASEALSGIYITKIREGTPAAACANIKRGMQILMVNDTNVEDATMAECRALLQASNTLSLLLQENPVGFAAYEAKVGFKRPEVNFHGTQNTEDMEKQLDTLFGEMVNFSTDMAYHAPMQVVGGKAVFV